MSKTIKRAAVVATVLCTMSMAAQAEGPSDTDSMLNGLSANGMHANALTSNRITTNALILNKITTNAVLPNVGAGSADERDSGARGTAIDFGTLSTEVLLIQALPKDKD
jgi:hypothetical protein